jgi:hypothetical protein
MINIPSSSNLLAHILWLQLQLFYTNGVVLFQFNFKVLISNFLSFLFSFMCVTMHLKTFTCCCLLVAVKHNKVVVTVKL